MSKHIELGLNNIVNELHLHYDNVSEREVAERKLALKAQSLLDEFGVENEEERTAVLETPRVEVKIPFNPITETDQTLSMQLSEDLDNKSGLKLKVLVPSLLGHVNFFSFNKEKSEFEAGYEVKNWRGEHAELSELVIADQVIDYMKKELTKRQRKELGIRFSSRNSSRS